MFLTKLINSLRGIRFRLTLIYSTLFGLFICVFAYMLSNQYFASGREDFDSGLLNYAIDLSEYLHITEGTEYRIHFNLPKSEIKKAFPFILSNTVYTVRSIDGNILSHGKRSSNNMDIPFDKKLLSLEDYTHSFTTFDHQGESYRAVNVKISDTTGSHLIVQVATSLTALAQREREHLIITSTVVVILILFSSFISYLVAGNALAPIKVLTDTANMIAASNLSLRVPIIRTGDEIEELSKTLNTLLDRLETSFKAQEHFVSNASHQINTPLAIMKGELAVLESKERTLQEHQRFHKSLREELERLIDLVKNMLLVSRVESGLDSFVFNPVRLDDLLLGTSSRLNLKAKEKRILVRFNIEEELDLEVKGEKQLLEALFENILDNAIKYSPEDSTIQLNIKNVHSQIEVWIEDEGPGIDPKDVHQIMTKRFHRAKTHIGHGTGIGLPIAQKIAQFHNAEIEYRRKEPKGSLFIIRFKKDSTQ